MNLKQGLSYTALDFDALHILLTKKRFKLLQFFLPLVQIFFPIKFKDHKNSLREEQLFKGAIPKVNVLLN